ncbi:MAG: hypothetical protein ABGX16_13830 [Pirellulales bacterium]
MPKAQSPGAPISWRTGQEQIDSYRKPLAECSMKEMWQGQLDAELTQLDSLREQILI